MKKLFILLSLSLAIVVMQAPFASAITFDAGQNLNITQDIVDDVYLVAGNANVDANILNDLYIGGGSVMINGNIGEDLVVSGGWVTIMGDIGGDLRVLGGNVSVFGNVGDDIVLAGGKVDIGRDSVVGGSLATASGLLTVEGEINEDIRGGAGMLILNGKVNGDVTVTIQEKLDISEKAKIGGDLKYSALIEMNIPENAVGGEIHFNKFEEVSLLKDLTMAFFIYKFLSYVSILVIMLLIILSVPKILVRSAELTKENVLKSFGIGFLTIIIAFVGALVLISTVVGIPISIIIFSILLILFYISKIFACVWIANYAMRFKKKRKNLKWRMFWSTALVLLAYFIVGLIPIIGQFVTLVLFMIGIGSIAQIKMEYWKFLRDKKML